MLLYINAIEVLANFINLLAPKDVRRTFFNRIVVLEIFETVSVVFGDSEQIHSILL